jgi:hypothetical protein
LGKRAGCGDGVRAMASMKRYLYVILQFVEAAKDRLAAQVHNAVPKANGGALIDPPLYIILLLNL